MQHNCSKPDEIVTLLPQGRDGVRLPEIPGVVTETSVLRYSRREVLRAGGVGGALLLTGFHPRLQPSARAFEPVTTLFTALITWFVYKALDATVGDRFKNQARFQEQPPAPTGGQIVLHDAWGNPWIVQNVAYPWAYSAPHGCYFSLQKYPRAMRPNPERRYNGPYDYNFRELRFLQQLDKEQELNSFPFPWGARQPPDREDLRLLRKTFRENPRYKHVDPDEWQIEYRRPFNSENWKDPKPAFGIANKRERREKSFVLLDV